MSYATPELKSVTLGIANCVIGCRVLVFSFAVAICAVNVTLSTSPVKPPVNVIPKLWVEIANLQTAPPSVDGLNTVPAANPALVVLLVDTIDIT